MKQFYNKAKQQKIELIEEIKKVCKQLVEKDGTLDYLDIQISTLGEEVNIYEIKTDEEFNTLFIISDYYNCNIKCLNFDREIAL